MNYTWRQKGDEWVFDFPRQRGEHLPAISEIDGHYYAKSKHGYHRVFDDLETAKSWAAPLQGTATYQIDDITTAIIARDGEHTAVILVQADKAVVLNTVAIRRLGNVFDRLDDTNDEAEAFRIA